MNVAELVNAVASKTNLSLAQTRSVLKTTLETIQKEVKRGGRVSIVGFGAFYQTTRKARMARNPQTGQLIKVATTKVPRFKAGKEFRQSLRKPKK